MNELIHYGIPGMKKGNRRFQNDDGSLTPAGERRYLDGQGAALVKYHDEHKRKFKKLGKKETTTPTNTAAESTKKSTKSSKSSSKAATSKVTTPKEPVEKVTAAKNTVQIHQAKGDVGVRKEDKMKAEGASIMEQPTANGQALMDQYAQRVDNAVATASAYNESHPNGPFMCLGVDGSVSYTKDKKVAEESHQAFVDFQKGQMKHSDAEDFLAHHGILGQKWHRRRYQNEDGSLTPEGRERYGVGEPRKGSVNNVKGSSSRKRTSPDAKVNRRALINITINKSQSKSKSKKKEDDKESRPRQSDDYKKYKELKRLKKSELTNDELDWLIKQQAKYNTYSNNENIARENALKSVSNGKEFVKALANRTVTSLITKGTEKLTEKAVEKAASTIVDRMFLNRDIEFEQDKKQRRIAAGLEKAPDDGKKDDKGTNDSSSSSSSDSGSKKKDKNKDSNVAKNAAYKNPANDDSSSSSKSSASSSAKKETASTSSDVGHKTGYKGQKWEKREIVDRDKVHSDLVNEWIARYNGSNKASEYATQQERRNKFIENYGKRKVRR